MDAFNEGSLRKAFMKSLNPFSMDPKKLPEEAKTVADWFGFNPRALVNGEVKPKLPGLSDVYPILGAPIGVYEQFSGHELETFPIGSLELGGKKEGE